MIELEDVWKIFGSAPEEVLTLARQGDVPPDVLKRNRTTLATAGITLSIKAGELFCIMGLSGSGKSTLVRLINRLIEPTAGSIRIDGTDITRFSPRELRALRATQMGMVFQSHALIPNLSVRDNVALPLEIRGEPRNRREDRADEVLDRVGLAGLGDKPVNALSGGQQQRVGLARALAADPPILLMDEPFSALDPLIRRQLQEEFSRLSRDLGKTVVFITHDVDEAVLIGDRLALLRGGRLIQQGTAEELVASPADDYVALFMGKGVLPRRHRDRAATARQRETA